MATRSVLATKGDTGVLHSSHHIREQQKFDHLFHSQVESDKLPSLSERASIGKRKLSEVSSAERMTHVAGQYFEALGRSIEPVDRMFDATSREARVRGSQQFMHVRKEAARNMFVNAVRPEIEKLMRQHGDERSFDEVVTIFGFNRLFRREIGSAGTDVDFFMLVDTEDERLLADIQALMKKEIAPVLAFMGVDMETADYLMIDMGNYLGKLSSTRHSLFTLANRGQVEFIAGSRDNLERAFRFSNAQLAEHFVNLLFKNGYIEETQVEQMRGTVLEKIESNPLARQECLNLLSQMASSELYIGKTPYKRKKTIQTELARVSGEKRLDRSEKISIKYNFNRIADMYLTTRVDPERRILSQTEIGALEELGMVLSNIKCRLDDESVHPLLKVQENYSDLTLQDLRMMDRADRVVVAELLEVLGQRVDPLSERFPEEAYDALWNISDRMGIVARALEENVYMDALTFARPAPAPSSSWGWAVAAGVGFVVLAGLGILARSKKWI